jgi:squalene-associated FAD-dependent desaturase
MNPNPRIVIVGGGLAGMAAAVALESAGLKPTLLEARRQLGGRAGSFQDPQSGQTLDNCQHVLLGCCTNLIDFYRRIGALHRIRFERTIRFARGDGKQWPLFGLPGLPAPFHLGPAFASFGLLSVAERLDLTRAMLHILRTPPEEFTRLLDVPFGQWLDAHRQTASLIAKLYDPIVISGLNEQTRAAGTAWAIKIFRDSLLVNSRGYLFGLPTCPLSELYQSLPLTDLRLGVRLAELDFTGDRVTAVRTQDAQTIPADIVILATNHHTLSQWIPDDLRARDRRFAGLDQLQSVPILGAHLWFDRSVLRTSHLALVDGPLQWLFRKNSDGRAIHGVISAARDWLTIPKDQCLQQFEQQITRLFPNSGAKLERGVVVIEKRATFSPLPGVESLRPPQAPDEGGIPNLFLAGDYTRTDWPATMEGAVRSGYLAAGAIMQTLSPDHPTFVVPDLPLQWPARSIRHFNNGRTTSNADK